MRGSASLSRLSLLGANIRGHLQIVGSRFSGQLDLSGAIIGEFVLYWPNGDTDISKGELIAEVPIWQQGVQVILRNMTAGALQANKESWFHDRDGWIVVDMVGFEYGRLTGSSGQKEVMIAHSADQLVEWLERTRPNRMKDVYDPGPYEHLAALLRREGMEGKADWVEYSKFVRRSEAVPFGTPWYEEHILWPLSWALVGYGVYPFKAVLWFLGLVAAGVAVGSASRDKKNLRGWVDRLWFSVENALPLVEPNERHKRIEHGRAWVDGFYHVQKLLGFLLATYLVGALTFLAV